MNQNHKKQTTDNRNKPIDLLPPSHRINSLSRKNPNQTQKEENAAHSISVKEADPGTLLP